MSYDPHDTGELRRDVARRLLLLRQAGHLSQGQVAELTGLSQPQYSQYETGKRLLTIHAAIAIVEVTGATLDYLYLGNASGLSYPLQTAIQRLARTLDT